MSKKFVVTLIFFLVLLAACRRPADLPAEFPAPPPAAGSTPVAKLVYKRDAELESQFAEIAEEAKGRVGAAAVIMETGEAAFLNADEHYPMQSVYKLPIAMAVIEKVKFGQLDLSEKVGVSKEDFVRRDQHSPLRDHAPDGGEFKIGELVGLSLVDSDGTASDVLLRSAGGPSEVQSYLTRIGIDDMKVANTEKDLTWKTQYDNWATPVAAISVLRQLCYDASPNGSPDCSAVVPIDELSTYRDHMRLVLYIMAASVPGAKRLKGLLPAGTIVAHKTGTGGTRDGIAAATNDIGIIYLPNGKHLAIAVFVSDSSAGEPIREAVIAKVAKAAWDRWQK